MNMWLSGALNAGVVDGNVLIPAGYSNSLQQLGHFTWHWAWPVNWHASLYIAVLSVIFLVDIKREKLKENEGSREWPDEIEYLSVHCNV